MDPLNQRPIAVRSNDLYSSIDGLLDDRTAFWCGRYVSAESCDHKYMIFFPIETFIIYSVYRVYSPFGYEEMARMAFENHFCSDLSIILT